MREVLLLVLCVSIHTMALTSEERVDRGMTPAEITELLNSIQDYAKKHSASTEEDRPITYRPPWNAIWVKGGVDCSSMNLNENYQADKQTPTVVNNERWKRIIQMIEDLQ